VKCERPWEDAYSYLTGWMSAPVRAAVEVSKEAGGQPISLLELRRRRNAKLASFTGATPEIATNATEEGA
jgi:hypothetical protein